MTLGDDEKWILTENLKRAEREDIERVDRGEDGSGSDFGAYRALLTGTNAGWVGMHAVQDNAYLASYIRQLANIVSGTVRPKNPPASLLDVGCGPGFLTDQLSTGLPCRAMGIGIR